ncbi:MAG: winged helix-turn-helix transcriptional regulator, partial [Bacteroidaceae bacterium]|nr:winged helix-turn-helix transcriptional regulator [Bacteroidaceae bacterium]
MLTYSFAGRQNEPLYEYLYRRIKEDIMSGEIPVGERLPSKRALARQLGVSTITVEGAYGQLAAEGYVQSIPKKGYFAADMRSTAVLSPEIREENICSAEAKPKYFADFTANNVTASDF